MKKYLTRTIVSILSFVLFLSVGYIQPVKAMEADFEVGRYATTSEVASYIEKGYDFIDNVVLYDEVSGDYLYVVDQHLINTNQNQLDLSITPYGAVATVAVFVLGMVIGWVVDGVITYATGKSPSEWVAIMTGAAVDLAKGLWRGAVKLYMDMTTKKPKYGMTSSGCVVQPNGTALCPMIL